jgi:hypothetical protein
MKNYIRLFYADTEVGAKLTLDSGEATNKLKEFKAELKAAQGEALAMADKFGPTSKAALDAAKKVAMLRDTIQDANETAKLFDPGNKFQVVGNAVRGLVGGFTALQGALGLVGLEGEDVQKTLLKVQSAMALMDGLNVVADMTKDWQRFGAVLQQTTAFQKINNVTTAAASGIMKALGISVNTTSTSFKVLKGAIAATGIGALLLLVGEAINLFNELTTAAEKAAEAEKRAFEIKEKGAAAQLSGEEEFIDRQEKLDIARAKAAGKSEKEIFDIEISWQKQRINSIRKYIGEVGESSAQGFEAKKRLAEAEDELELKSLQKLELNLKKRKEIIKKDQDFDVKEAEVGGQIIDPIKKLDPTDKYIDDLKREQQAEEEAINKRVELISSVRDLSRHAAEDNVADQASQAQAARDTAEAEEKAANARVQAAYAVGGALSALSDLIGRETAAGKALAIAQATINMWLGVTEVLKQKSVLPEPMATIAKISNVATIIASGLNAIKNITKTKVPGGSSGGGEGAASQAAPLQPRPPQATQTLLDQQQLNQIGNATVRAFVIESDVTNNQERIRRVNRAARI